MAEARIDYRPRGRTGFDCTLTAESGSWLTVSGLVGDLSPAMDGSDTLRANRALVNSLWACGTHDAEYRRLRSDEKRKSHAKQRDRHAAEAQVIAGMVEQIGDKTRTGWCSACFTDAVHVQVLGFSRPIPTYLCQACGSPTTRCTALRCPNMANRRPKAASGPRYCAEHRHDIPGFEKLEARLGSIEEYHEWLTFEKRNLSKVTKVVGIAVITGLVVAPGAFLAAPLIGGATGVLTGLEGAAAASHGLAVWGGGSLAAGGLGMAGGTMVITAVGGGLGGALGAVSTTAYTRSDSSFGIKKLRDGKGTPVLLASGFLTEKEGDWGEWKLLIDKRYAANPVYRVQWGAKELKAISYLAAGGAAKQVGRQALRQFAAKASKKAAVSVPGLGALLLASDLAKNPWSVAKNRAAMTGAVLADLMARTDDQRFILVGHSLGARVMVTAAQALGTKQGRPRIEAMHLLGAAVGASGDWRTLDAAVSDHVWNYRSENDNVLKYLYRSVQAGEAAAGVVGFGSSFPKISDRNVSRIVSSHSMYFTRVTLK